MENRTEDEIRKRWEQETKDKADRDEEAQQRPKKRVRAIEYQAVSGAFDGDGLDEIFGSTTANGKGAAKSRVTEKKKTGRATAGKARGKVTEILEDEDMVVELD